MPGPAPKPDSQRRRRNAMPPTMRLPAEGRTGEPPAWPLDGRPAPAWRNLWKLPQAVAWESMHLHRVVARYAVVLRLADEGERYATAEARQMEDRLGLSPMALARLRWQIGDGDAPDVPADVPNLNDYRDAI